MLWEVMNMSDRYTIESDDFESASLAVLLLGRGAYSLIPITQDAPEMPLFIFGGASDWFEKQFGRNLDESLAANRTKIADALDSVLIGGRERMLEIINTVPPDQRNEQRLKWHDIERSSLNDIGRRAWRMAARLRASV